MGVPRLYSYLQRRSKNVFSEEVKRDYERVAVDMNAELYPLIPKVERPATEQGRYEFFILLAERLFEIVNEFQPEELIIAFDGPPPVAKMIQQKSRRVNQGDLIDNDGWTNSFFSPGTELMEWISLRLKVLFSMMIKRGALQSVYYSSHRVPGEGEHKILRYLIREKSRPTIVLANDADLAVLFSLSNLDADVKRDNLFVNVTQLRRDLKKHFRSVENFTLCSFFIGNDFVHSVHGFNDLADSFDLMAKVIKEESLNLTSKGKIDFKALQTFVTKLQRVKNSRVNDRIVSLKYAETGRRETLNYKKVDLETSERWYMAMNWIWNYYKGNDINFLFQFVHNTHANLTSLSKLVINVDRIEKITTKNFQALTPVKTLISILPLHNLEIVNAKIRDKVTGLDDLYPLDFKMNMEGVEEDYLGFTILPPFPVGRIMKLPCLGELDIFEEDVYINDSFEFKANVLTNKDDGTFIFNLWTKARYPHHRVVNKFPSIPTECIYLVPNDLDHIEYKGEFLVHPNSNSYIFITEMKKGSSKVERKSLNVSIKDYELRVKDSYLIDLMSSRLEIADVIEENIDFEKELNQRLKGIPKMRGKKVKKFIFNLLNDYGPITSEIKDAIYADFGVNL